MSGGRRRHDILLSVYLFRRRDLSNHWILGGHLVTYYASLSMSPKMKTGHKRFGHHAFSYVQRTGLTPRSVYLSSLLHTSGLSRLAAWGLLCSVVLTGPNTLVLLVSPVRLCHRFIAHVRISHQILQHHDP